MVAPSSRSQSPIEGSSSVKQAADGNILIVNKIGQAIDLISPKRPIGSSSPSITSRVVRPISLLAKTQGSEISNPNISPIAELFQWKNQSIPSGVYISYALEKTRNETEILESFLKRLSIDLLTRGGVNDIYALTHMKALPSSKSRRITEENIDEPIEDVIDRCDKVIVVVTSRYKEIMNDGLVHNITYDLELAQEKAEKIPGSIIVLWYKEQEKAQSEIAIPQQLLDYPTFVYDKERERYEEQTLNQDYMHLQRCKALGNNFLQQHRLLLKDIRKVSHNDHK